MRWEHWFYTLPLRIRSLFRRSQVESELDEELRYHLERQMDANITAGMSELEARRVAFRDLGGVERRKDECRDARGLALIDALARDVKLAIRRLTLDWQFTTAAVLILALGIGVNTAVFSLVNAALFRPQAFPNSDRLVNLYQNVGDPARPHGVSYPAYRDIAESTDVFSGVTVVQADDARYQGGEDLQTALVEYTTSSFLDVLGYQLSAGRWFTESDDRAGGQPTAVIGYRTWQSKFASDYDIIGQTIRLNGMPVTIVGIGPQQLTSAMHPTLVTDFWLSMSTIDSVESGTFRSRVLERRGELMFEARAHLREGVSLAQAQAAVDVVASRMATEHPDTDPGKGITLIRSDEVIIHPGEPDMLLAFGATVLQAIVSLVLAIACSNLATLLLVRGTSRATEVSVRLALGATKWQLVRHFLAESVLLAVAGAVAGFVLSEWTLRYLSTLIPLSFDLRTDYRVLGFTLALSLVTGIAFGLAPALRSTRIDLLPALRGEGGSLSFTRGWFTLKNSLLAIQVAGSFLLLMSTGFLIRAVMSIQSQEPGFAIQGVALLRTEARLAGYNDADGKRLNQELLRRIAAIPGVQSAFASAGGPVGSSVGRQIELEGAPQRGGRPINVESTWASPGYFETLQIPLLFGREFTDYDLADRPQVTIINETMARRIFGTPNAVGRRFRYGGIEQSQEEKVPVEIVGVVRDSSSLQFFPATEPLFYLSAAQSGAETSTLVARTSLDASGLVQAMQREVRDLDPSLPVSVARTMEQQLERGLLIWKRTTAVLGGFGALALALASVGLYAVVKFAVAKRSVELGIRMALGARSGQVIWLVMREVTVLIGATTAVGAVLSLAGLALVESMTQSASGVRVNIPGADPSTILIVALVLAATAGAAAYVPARRAAKGDPALSLRHQ